MPAAPGFPYTRRLCLMTMTSGTRLGPYEIAAPLGAGGMGAVYRARDTRLGRDVAIKIMPASLATDPERTRRFQQEATATGMLNHPNLLAIHDVGDHEGAPYLVCELLEGQTLRERLEASSPLPVRRAVEYALQIAQGLGAAHEKGIVHRDLKPENVFITRDGRVKILDFGLAKLAAPLPGARALPDPQAATITVGSNNTEPGVVLGTVGYMAPEQVRGEPADQRADLFAFGAILYEMLSGSRAFRRNSAIETLNAILKEEPPDPSDLSAAVPPALDRVVRRCLEKNPESRFQSASDLGFALESLSGLSMTGSTVRGAPPARGGRRLRPIVLAVATCALVTAAAFWAGTRWSQPSIPQYIRQTFRQGLVYAARFAPDGETLLYGASWDGKPPEVYLTRSDTPESRPLDLADASILDVSPSGEMALNLRLRLVKPFLHAGTLAQASLGGGTPREVVERVTAADWGPNGKSLAVVREHDGLAALEYPVGSTLYRSSGWLSDPQVAGDGSFVAVIDHPVIGDQSGTILLIDRKGISRALGSPKAGLWGMAWSPTKRELWFTANISGPRAIYATSLEGEERVVLRVPGSVRLFDIDRSGRVLMSRDSVRISTVGRFNAGDKQDDKGEKERDVSWLEQSLVADVSADGRLVVFGVGTDGVGPSTLVYIRRTDGSPAIKIGEGRPCSLSQDGKWVLAITSGRKDQIVMIPTGPGMERPLRPGAVEAFYMAHWLRDSGHVVFVGSERGKPSRLYLQEIDGEPKPTGPEGIGFAFAVSPQGDEVAAIDARRTLIRIPLAGTSPAQPIAGAEPEDIPISWSSQGSLFVYRIGELPAQVVKIDLKTGKRTAWKTFMPADPSGIVAIGPIVITPDEKSYAYTFHRVFSDLYVVEGLK